MLWEKMPLTSFQPDSTRYLKFSCQYRARRTLEQPSNSALKLRHSHLTNVSLSEFLTWWMSYEWRWAKIAEQYTTKSNRDLLTIFFWSKQTKEIWARNLLGGNQRLAKSQKDHFNGTSLIWEHCYSAMLGFDGNFWNVFDVIKFSKQ